MERMIGDLGSEIKQPSLPFENLAQRALRRAQNNVLQAMFPDLDPIHLSQAPKHDLGDGYTLLHPRQPGPRSVEDHEDVLIMRYIENVVGTEEARSVWVEEMQCCVQKWARCRLPNGQICRSAWKEIANNMTRIARNVKYKPHGSSRFEYAEVQYYFQCPLAAGTQTLAIVSKYGPPNEELLQASSGVVWACCKPNTHHALAVTSAKPDPFLGILPKIRRMPRIGKT
ncbi:hypothetical protein LXA43DRAFT_1143119 [Ganoderma leucocontextum]|nr:hypothetical protein LXA43DRAFT_1143119 [Ganoderma leucocontextum]